MRRNKTGGRKLYNIQATEPKFLRKDVPNPTAGRKYTATRELILKPASLPGATVINHSLIPKGAKEYFFDSDGPTFITKDSIFSCIARNMRNALRKFTNFKKAA